MKIRGQGLGFSIFGRLEGQDVVVHGERELKWEEYGLRGEELGLKL